MSLFLTLVSSALCSAEKYVHSFYFNESDYSISPSRSDSLLIKSLVDPARYPDPDEPGLPVQVSIVNTESGLNRQFDITDSYGTATVDVSGIPGGVYVASVCVDGRLADGTKRVIINR